MCRATFGLLLLFIIFSRQDVYSQRLGLLPSKTKWYQVQHDSLRVIYPEGQEETALRAASMMLKVARYDPIDPKSRYKRISVLLQPSTNISNGYVGLAPYVSEFYLQPHENPFELGSLPWEDLLAIHEFRHVQQVNAANTGLSHLVKVVLGELAFSGMIGLSVSNWLREGDAVFTETKWTPQGRGRLNYFMLPFREKSKEGKPWPYFDLRNGSYQKYLPNEYQLGFLMVMYGKMTFGEAVWDTIFRQAPRFKDVFEPMTSLVKEYYGSRNRFLYEDATEWYKHLWRSEDQQAVEYSLIPLREKDLKNDFFDMAYPSVDTAGNIFVNITTFDSIPTIYRIHPDGSRKKIVSPGLQQDPYFDWSADKLVWTELRYNPRWVRKDKNVIVVYDISSKRKRSFETKKGYYTPSFNREGDKIVTVHTTESNLYHLQVLDANSGDIENQLPNKENLVLGYPCFNADETAIIATARNSIGEMSLVEQNIESGEIRQITPYSYFVLGRPVLVDSFIMITTGLGYVDQVYAIHLTNGSIYKVSEGNSAHYNPAYDASQQSLVCPEYELKGKKLVRIPLLPGKWHPMSEDDGIKSLIGIKSANLLTDFPKTDSFEIKKYNPWSNAINFHSWVLTADDPVWGIEVRSDNIMNTVSMAAGYEYNRNNSAGGPYIDVSIRMWFPVLNVGFNSISREVTLEDGSESQFSYDQLYGGFSFPFVFSPGIYNMILQYSTTYNKGVTRLRPLPEGVEDFHFNYSRHRIIFVNSRHRAYRQPLPSWGQRFDLSYAHEMTGVNVNQFYAGTDLAFPAVWPTHYLTLVGESLVQDVNEESVQLNSNYAGARGYDILDGAHNYRVGITYGLPIAYPDIGFGSIFYVSRVRVNPFFDMAYTDSRMSLSNELKSTGVEVLLDFDVSSITVGFRYSRLLSPVDGSKNAFDIYIPLLRF